LVALVGAFAGLCIQFVFPACLVLFGRFKLKKLYPILDKQSNVYSLHKSPFGHWIIAIAVLIFSTVGIIYNSYIQIRNVIVSIIKLFKKN
jgi:hypothetical protein